MTPVRHKRLIKIGLPVLLFVLVALLVFFKDDLTGWLHHDQPYPVLSIHLPGQASLPEANGMAADPEIADRLQSKLDELLLRTGSDSLQLNKKENDQSTAALLSWIQLAGRTGNPGALEADTIQASDQLAYAVYLVEQKKKESYLSWQKSFETLFMSADLPAEYLTRQEGIWQTGPQTWTAGLQYARVLLLAQANWPTQSGWLKLNALSRALLAPMTAAELPVDTLVAVPTQAAAPDPAATPTPKPAMTPAPAAVPADQPVMTLAQMDLWTILQLVQIDPAWQAVYDQWLEIIQGGYLGDNLPLYALAVWPDQSGYLPYVGDQPSVDTQASIAVILHLCEVNQANPQSISWLRTQIYDNRALYTRYHIVQGQATTTEEAIGSYALTARIARIVKDSSFYAKAIDRLTWHLATSQKSLAYGTVFRQDAAGLIRVYAADNVWALLAMK